MCNENREQGYVLLAVLLAVFVGGSSMMLGVYNNRRMDTELRQHDELIHQMELAKAALLTYAANSHQLFGDTIGPGYLPCPDVNNNGQPGRVQDTGIVNPYCLSGNTLGRLPQYALLPDGSQFKFSDYLAEPEDQQFWLVVAPQHLRTGPTPNNKGPEIANANLQRLSLDGRIGYAALIIAPGLEISPQRRTGTGKTIYSNYLDGTNGSSSTNFFSVFTTNPDAFNDRILGITHDELMRFVGASVTTRIWNDLAPLHTTNGEYPTSFFYNGTQHVETIFVTAIKNNWVPNTVENWLNEGAANFPSPYHIYNSLYRTLSNTLHYEMDGNNAFRLRLFGCNNMTFRMTSDGDYSRLDTLDPTLIGNSCQ